MKPERIALWTNELAKLVVVWPFLTPTRERILVWDAALADFSEEKIREGVARLIANHGSATPTPGELRDAILGPVSWETVRHHIDGKVMGRREVRSLASDAKPAPQELADLDRKRLSLPREVHDVVDRLSDRMRP